MTGLDELPLHRAQVSVFWGFLGFYFVLRLNLILYFQPRLVLKPWSPSSLAFQSLGLQVGAIIPNSPLMTGSVCNELKNSSEVRNAGDEKTSQSQGGSVWAPSSPTWNPQVWMLWAGLPSRKEANLLGKVLITRYLGAVPLHGINLNFKRFRTFVC